MMQLPEQMVDGVFNERFGEGNEWHQTGSLSKSLLHGLPIDKHVFTSNENDNRNHPISAFTFTKARRVARPPKWS